MKEIPYTREELVESQIFALRNGVNGIKIFDEIANSLTGAELLVHGVTTEELAKLRKKSCKIAVRAIVELIDIMVKKKSGANTIQPWIDDLRDEIDAGEITLEETGLDIDKLKEYLSKATPK